MQACLIPSGITDTGAHHFPRFNIYSSTTGPTVPTTSIHDQLITFPPRVSSRISTQRFPPVREDSRARCHLHQPSSAPLAQRSAQIHLRRRLPALSDLDFSSRVRDGRVQLVRHLKQGLRAGFGGCGIVLLD
jgi:hypothetical protein